MFHVAVQDVANVTVVLICLGFTFCVDCKVAGLLDLS